LGDFADQAENSYLSLGVDPSEYPGDQSKSRQAEEALAKSKAGQD